MFDLPRNTEVNKKIPKSSFYTNLDLNTKLKNIFVDQIENINWANKLSEETININKGKEVTEIQVFLINLKQKSLDEQVLYHMDRSIPYHLVYILKYEDLYQIVIGYKEQNTTGNSAFKVKGFYYTDWETEDNLKLEINGLDLDTVYESFIRYTGSERLNINQEETIEESIERDAEIQDLKKKIDRCKSKMKRTKQLNKQVKISDEIRELEKELKELL